jgi:two-component system KDP operon response regulator KdpE
MMRTLTALIIAGGQSRQRIAAALQDAGFMVIEAVEGRDGLRHVLDDAPHLVVIDEDMPPIDDIEVLPILRRLTESPIIVVGSGGEGPTVQALLEGADMYLPRSVDVSELLARIRALLRRYGAARGFTGEPLLEC